MRISQENEVSYRQESRQSPPPHQEKKTHCLKFPPSARLRKRTDFLSVQRSKERFSGHFLQMDYRSGATSAARLGITVSKRYGKAHDRNRFKRLVREAFRLKRHLLPPIDLNVLPKKGAIPHQMQDCARDFEKLIDVLIS